MGRIKTKELAKLCRRMGQSLYAGIDIRKALASEANRASPAARDCMAEVSRKVNRGEALHKSFAEANSFFPPLFCEMVEVGEQTGHIDQVFTQLADHYEHVLKVRSEFLQAIAWPVFQLIAAVLVIGVLIWVLGVLGAPFGVFGLKGAGGAAIWFTTFGCLAGTLALALYAWRQGWIDLSPAVRLLTQLPGSGLFFQTQAMAKLTWSLALSTSAGIDPMKAVRMSLRSTQNAHYSTHTTEMNRLIRKGSSLTDAFREAKAFPADFLDTLAAGEEAGSVSESMAILSKQYDERAKYQMQIFGRVCGISVWLLVAAMIIVLIFKLFFEFYLNPMNELLEM